MFAFTESTQVPIGEWHCDKAKVTVVASAKGWTGSVTSLYWGQNLVWRIYLSPKSPPERSQWVQGRETLGVVSVLTCHLLRGALLLFRNCFCHGQPFLTPLPSESWRHGEVFPNLLQHPSPLGFSLTVLAWNTVAFAVLHHDFNFPALKRSWRKGCMRHLCFRDE